nr:fimbria/pilus periplasmic chaperone [uncultured Moellerella sp.]
MLYKKNLLIFATLFMSTSVNAALSLDRTRIIFNETQKSNTLNVSNTSKNLPYLAQSWLENSKGEKIQSPFMVVPPIQRIEPEKPAQLKIEKLPTVAQLPQDRESLFYFNFREIPPKSEKENVLQLSIQTNIKLFYRPKSIVVTGTQINNNPWQEKLTLVNVNNKPIANNPTAYHITIIGISNDRNKEAVNDFKSFMVPPFSEMAIDIPKNSIGNSPILTYIDDYGGKVKMRYTCQLNNCSFSEKI